MYLKRYWRLAIGVILLAAAAVAFVHRDGNWTLVLSLASVMLLGWPLISWLTKQDASQDDMVVQE